MEVVGGCKTACQEHVGDLTLVQHHDVEQHRADDERDASDEALVRRRRDRAQPDRPRVSHQRASSLAEDMGGEVCHSALNYIACMASHGHDHGDGSELSELQLRVRALETVLVEKGYVDSEALDRIVESYETKIGPHSGRRVVARAWADPGFKAALLDDATAAVGTLGLESVSHHLVAVENTPELHNIVVCTLCSCYPWDLLGLPPVWYKSAPYRSRAVKDPRSVLADFGVELPPKTEIRVWDSTAETRFLVVPMRPAGTEAWDEEELASLVTRDSMVGTGLPGEPVEAA
jgi:nitrile hydratase subunit alpha